MSHQVPKGEQRQRAYVRQVVAEAAVKDFSDFRRASTGVNANGHTQTVGGLVHREKIGLCQGALFPLRRERTRPPRRGHVQFGSSRTEAPDVPQRWDDHQRKRSPPCSQAFAR